MAPSWKAEFDLCHLLKYPITTFPLPLAYSDGTPLKTGKAALTKTLETKQSVMKNILPSIIATVIDGGTILLQSYATLNQHMQQWHVICWKECAQVMETVFTWYSISTSPHQSKTARQSCVVHTLPLHLPLVGIINRKVQLEQNSKKMEHLRMSLLVFVMDEWKNQTYWSIIQTKTVFVSHGG